jgi:hypothetical protein
MFWRSTTRPGAALPARVHARSADELGVLAGHDARAALPFLPPERFGTPVVGLVIAWAGDLDEGRARSRRCAGSARHWPMSLRPIPYLALQSMLDGGAPHGRHYYWKSHRLETFSDETIEILVERVASCTSPFAQTTMAMGGAVSASPRTRPRSESARWGFDVSLAVGWPPSDPDPDATAHGRGTAGRRWRAELRGVRNSSPTKAPPAWRPPTATASPADGPEGRYDPEKRLPDERERRAEQGGAR